MTSRLIRALDTAISIPRSERAQRIKVGQLRLLAEIALPIVTREAPINVGILRVLTLIEREPEIATDSLLSTSGDSEPTLKSRLQYLERKGLIERHPTYNTGGKQPN